MFSRLAIKLVGIALEMGLAESILAKIDEAQKPDKRPFITLSYAQSLDGCIAARRGKRLQISGQESAQLTHKLRAHHDSILVGVGTVLADDPQLTVRLVDGDDPQPVILDSQLRIPSDAFLINARYPWIATTNQANPIKLAEFEAHGLKLLILPTEADGYVSLPDLLECLVRMGVERLMVEGGAQVISSFIAHRLVDFLVVTISPLIIGGLQSMQLPLEDAPNLSVSDFPKLDEMVVGTLGQDLIVWGRPQWPEIQDN